MGILILVNRIVYGPVWVHWHMFMDMAYIEKCA